MADSEYNNASQPKKIVWHPPKFENFMMSTTGVIDSNVDFDHTFLQWNLEMKYYRKVEEAIRNGIVGKPTFRGHGIKKEGITINPVAWRKMKHVWFYGIDILIQRDVSDQVILAYAPLYNPIKKLMPHQRLIHYPALKRMNPVGKLADGGLGVYIRDLVPVPLAWEGHDIATMVTAGGFYYKFANGNIPYFNKPEDVSTSEAWTYYVSRPFFHSAIDILETEFTEASAVVFIDNHRIIESEVLGYLENENQVVKAGKKIATKVL